MPISVGAVGSGLPGEGDPDSPLELTPPACRQPLPGSPPCTPLVHAACDPTTYMTTTHLQTPPETGPSPARTRL